MRDSERAERHDSPTKKFHSPATSTIEMSLPRGGSYPSPWSSQTALSEFEGAMGELEPLGELAEVGFEPQTRARSNTWPLPRPENYMEPEDSGSKKNSNQNLSGKYLFSRKD